MPESPTFELFLLTWTAGIMDALSYLRAGVFTANMTGNTVVLGLAIAGRERSRAVPALAALCAFATGCLIGSFVLLRRSPRRHWSDDLKLGSRLELPFVAAFVLLSALEPGRPPYPVGIGLTILAAISLGIQSVAVRQLRIAGVVTTFITGTMTTAVASWVAKRDPGSGEQARGSPLLLGSILLCYVIAAAVGAALLSRARLLPSILALAAVVTVLVRVRSFSDLPR
jgi:uncharacterized membrane protein YoaK (UPF0700 family)